MVKPRIVLLIFVSGKVVLTGKYIVSIISGSITSKTMSYFVFITKNVLLDL